jgi:hypothetical protein
MRCTGSVSLRSSCTNMGLINGNVYYRQLLIIIIIDACLSTCHYNYLISLKWWIICYIAIVNIVCIIIFDLRLIFEM